MKVNRHRRFLWLAVVLLAIAWIASLVQARRTRVLLEQERDNTLTVRQLAAEIEQLRQLPEIAGVEPASEASVLSHIQEAADAVPLPARSLLRIQPESAVILGESSYRIRPIRLELRDVSLQQLVTFSHYLALDGTGYTVRDLEFWHGSRSTDDLDEGWRAELTLTQLIFSPIRRSSVAATGRFPKR